MPGPMHGVKILDFSVALTGPLAVGMLADQGADVVKIERPPGGDQARYIGTARGGISAMFQVANRGKRSIVVDLTQPAGVELALRLADDADVVVHNYRPGAADRMGIGYDAIRARNPGVVYVAISGFGQHGPYAHRRVYDTVIQAQSGLADNQRGRDDPAPVLHRQLTADKVTAYTAAQAITAALFHRERTGEGQLVTLSMLDATIAFLFVDGAGHQVVLDGDHSGPTSAAATTTPMAFADGFAVVAPVTDAEFHGFAGAFGVDSSAPGLATMADRGANAELVSATVRAIRAAASTVSLAEAVAALEAAQVPYGVVVPVEAVPDDPQVLANELFAEHVHPAMGRVRQTRPPAIFDGSPAIVRAPDAPTLGQHTDDVLAAIGWDDRTESLRAAGIVR